MNTAYIYSHTHWDREWYLTQRQFQFLLAQTFDEIVELLETRPDFASFVADGQTMVFSDYMELRPEMRDRFLTLARDGRLELGPWYTMPDLWIPSGESIIRNLLNGCLDCEELGLSQPKVGYVPDSFGHIEQMPQIMNGFGITNYLFGRGDTMTGLGSCLQFVWRGPDGRSAVTAHRLVPDGYGNAAGLATGQPEKLKHHIGRLLEHFSLNSSKPQMALLCNGIDHIWVQRDLPEALIQLGEIFPDWKFVHSTLSRYLKEFANEPFAHELINEAGTLHGGHMSEGMLHGTWSSRMDTKLANAQAEYTLTGLAEPLSALAHAWGGGDRRPESKLAWRLTLANHAHDSMCGCSMDAVHADNLRRFGQAVELGEMIAGEALDNLNSLAIREDRPTLLRWSGLGGAKGCVEFIIDQDLMGANSKLEGSNHDFYVVGSDGVPYPVQIVKKRRLLRSDVAFDSGDWKFGKDTEALFDEVKAVAALPDAPPCSVDRFAIVDGPCPTQHLLKDRVVVESCSGDDLGPSAVMENGWIRVEVISDGTLQVTHKATGTRYCGLLALVDEADLGGGYVFRPLSGDVRRYTNIGDSKIEFRVDVLEKGPLRGAVRLTGLWSLPYKALKSRDGRTPEFGNVAVETVVRLEAGSCLLSCQSKLDNRCKDHRIRLVLPLPYDTTAVDVERAFVVAKDDMKKFTSDPGQNSHPMRNWVAASSPELGGGLAFIGKGLHEYSISDNSLEITLLRCVPFVHDCGTWETPDAQIQGEITFSYAIAFYDGDWRSGAVAEMAHRFIYPAVAEVKGTERVPWDDVLHASVRLMEVEETGLMTYTSTHRSSWRTVFGHRDGWRKREECRLPTIQTPENIRPISIDLPNIFLSTMKLAERARNGGRDTSSDLIVRLYSLSDKVEEAAITLGAPIPETADVYTANLAEEPQHLIKPTDGRHLIKIQPFEIVTLRIGMK